MAGSAGRPCFVRTDPGVWSIPRTVCTVTRRGSALYGSMSELLRAPDYSVLGVLEFSQINILALSIMSVICMCSGFTASHLLSLVLFVVSVAEFSVTAQVPFWRLSSLE